MTVVLARAGMKSAPLKLSDRLEAFIAEIQRCLRPGGHVLITAPARDNGPVTHQKIFARRILMSRPTSNPMD